MNNKLTIILTLKDRTEFTIRWLNYMNDMKCPYQILIADGGESAVIQDILKDKSNYPNLIYLYIRYPFDLNVNFYYKKLLDIVSRVSTPYMLFADNDDFFILKHFHDYIEFLDNNKGFVSYGGDNLYLDLLSNKNKVLNTPYSKNYIAYSYNQFHSIDFESSTDRLIYFFNNVEKEILWCCWYNINRTSAVKKAFEILSEYHFKEFVAFEIHFHFSMLTIGKYKKNSKLFYIRQNGTSQATTELNAKSNLFRRFIENDTYKEFLKSIYHINPLMNDKNLFLITEAYLFWLANSGSYLYNYPKKRISLFMQIFLNKFNSFILFYSIRLVKEFFYRTFTKQKKTFHRVPFLEKYIKN